MYDYRMLAVGGLPRSHSPTRLFHVKHKTVTQSKERDFPSLIPLTTWDSCAFHFLINLFIGKYNIIIP